MSHRKPPNLRTGHLTKAQIAAQEARAANKAAAVATLFPGTSEPASANPLASPPSYLSEPAKAVWALAVPPLLRIRILADADVVAFSRYCEWLALFLDVQQAKRNKKAVVRPRGSAMQRVDRSLQLLLQIDKVLMGYEDRFAMSPQARQAILSKLAAGFSFGQEPPPSSPGPTDKPKSPIGFLNTGSKPPRLQ